MRGRTAFEIARSYALLGDAGPVPVALSVEKSAGERGFDDTAFCHLYYGSARQVTLNASMEF